MKNRDRQQIAHWVELLLDDQISAAEFEQLEQVIANDSDAQDLYLQLRYLDARLLLDGVHHAATRPAGRRDDKTSTAKGDTQPANRHQTASSRKRFIGMLAVVAVLPFLLVWWAMPPGDVSSVIIAEITDSSDAVWAECMLPTAVGSQLSAGRLKIDRGLVTIRFKSGAEVILESPAELQLETAMRGTLLAGIAIVEVPDSAHGFTIATPTAEAIDHGTAFAVIVDASRNVSSVEVLAGEVEVRHNKTNASRHLFKQQHLTATEDTLVDSTVSSADLESATTVGEVPNDLVFQRVTTAMGNGRDTTVSRGSVSGHKADGLVLIKNPYEGFERYGRKGYFAFDLSSISDEQITAARFVLTLQPSGLGFASRVPDCEFTVYGLTDEARDDWSAQHMDWQTAPANLSGATELDMNQVQTLGRFVVTRGQQYGQVTIEGQQLVDFLNADTNNRVTFIVVRNTKEDQENGLVHGFASRFNATAAPPTLLIRAESAADRL